MTTAKITSDAEIIAQRFAGAAKSFEKDGDAISAEHAREVCNFVRAQHQKISELTDLNAELAEENRLTRHDVSIVLRARIELQEQVDGLSDETASIRPTIADLVKRLSESWASMGWTAAKKIDRILKERRETAALLLALADRVKVLEEALGHAREDLEYLHGNVWADLHDYDNSRWEGVPQVIAVRLQEIDRALGVDASQQGES